jgi:hypothetical protein
LQTTSANSIGCKRENELFSLPRSDTNNNKQLLDFVTRKNFFVSSYFVFLTFGIINNMYSIDLFFSALYLFRAILKLIAGRTLCQAEDEHHPS